MRVDEAVGVGRAAKAATRGESAAGATAGIGRRLRVAGPHQLVLLVVAEVLRFGAGGAARQVLYGGADAGDVAGGIVAAALVKDLAALPATVVPTGGLLTGPQVTVMAELFGSEVTVARAADVGERVIDPIFKAK
jgi:hypothetical protein